MDKPAPRTPPDYNRCQAQRKSSFMIMGPEEWLRCEEKPVVVATERNPHLFDGQRGSMSLCANCLRVMKQQLGDDFATIEAI